MEALAPAMTETTHTHTILVVDDEAEILESLRRTLRKEPWRVLTTTSPEEALRILEHQSVDVLVTDIDMPTMNGLELVDRARAKFPEVVRMLLTGAASLESALRAINDGEVHRYLTKPWEAAEIRKTIRGALDRLDELRRAARAHHDVDVRERLLAELEREHPGIRDVHLQDGVYVLDADRLAAFLDERHQVLLRRTIVDDFDGDCMDPTFRLKPP
jgi:two-component system probable response regulator PhcQ